MFTQEDTLIQHVKDYYKEYTYDMFMMNVSQEPEEMILFSNWVDQLDRENVNSFEAVRSTAQKT